MTTLKTVLAALALAAISTAAYAAAEQPEDVTTAINSPGETPASLPSMQPAAGDANVTAPDTTTTTATTTTTTTTGAAIIDSITAEKMAMRRLWEDHLSYTRNFIISELGGLHDVPAVSDRLMKNQDDIGEAIKPYYGAGAGAKLSSLLRGHIAAAVDVVKAAKGKNKKALDDAQAKATSNADEIAAFLANANTNWSKDELADMLHKHLDLLTAQVNARLKKDWKSDIDAYDQGEDHMLKFSDMLVDGIAKQYPEKFSMPNSVQPSSGP